MHTVINVVDKKYCEDTWHGGYLNSDHTVKYGLGYFYNIRRDFQIKGREGAPRCLPTDVDKIVCNAKFGYFFP